MARFAAFWPGLLHEGDFLDGLKLLAGGIMTAVAIHTSKSPNVLGLVAAILLSIFAISLPFVVPDPGSRDVSELHFIGP